MVLHHKSNYLSRVFSPGNKTSNQFLEQFYIELSSGCGTGGSGREPHRKPRKLRTTCVARSYNFLQKKRKYIIKILQKIVLLAAPDTFSVFSPAAKRFFCLTIAISNNEILHTVLLLDWKRREAGGIWPTYCFAG